MFHDLPCDDLVRMFFVCNLHIFTPVIAALIELFRSMEVPGSATSLGHTCASDLSSSQTAVVMEMTSRRCPLLFCWTVRSCMRASRLKTHLTVSLFFLSISYILPAFFSAHLPSRFLVLCLSLQSHPPDRCGHFMQLIYGAADCARQLGIKELLADIGP